MIDSLQVLGIGTDALVALDRRLDVGRRHFLAVVELDAPAQFERVGLEIGRCSSLRRQHRLRGIVVVEGHQAFEDIVDDLEFDGARGDVRVERAGPRDGGVDQRAALLRLWPRAVPAAPSETPKTRASATATPRRATLCFIRLLPEVRRKFRSRAPRSKASPRP